MAETFLYFQAVKCVQVKVRKRVTFQAPITRGEGTLPVKFACKTRANFNPLARITLAQG